MAKLVRIQMVLALTEVHNSQLSRNQHCDMQFPIKFVELDTHDFQLRKLD